MTPHRHAGGFGTGYYCPTCERLEGERFSCGCPPRVKVCGYTFRQGWLTPDPLGCKDCREATDAAK